MVGIQEEILPEAQFMRKMKDPSKPSTGSTVQKTTPGTLNGGKKLPAVLPQMVNNGNKPASR
jgi:hypothetical protein